MVRGLTTFKKYFEKYANNYVIIGGTACDMIIGEAGFNPRATRDIDMILVVEALSTDFVKQFWKFIEDGNYRRKEKNEEDRKYYRFILPEKEEFPYQVELFSRNPDLFDLNEGTHLTPIPVDDDLTSLSAILLDEVYYSYLMEHCKIDNSLQRANTEALICMKARAFLDMDERKANGEIIDEKNIRKHKSDVFRLAVMLTENDVFELPEKIKSDMQAFVEKVSANLPDANVFKMMGLNGVNTEIVLAQLKANFKLE